MYAVIMRTELDGERVGEAETMLNEQVVPAVKAMPGFVSGIWARHLDNSAGTSLLVFDSEESARAAVAAAQAMAPPPQAPVTYGVFELARVIAQA